MIPRRTNPDLLMDGLDRWTWTKLAAVAQNIGNLDLGAASDVASS